MALGGGTVPLNSPCLSNAVPFCLENGGHSSVGMHFCWNMFAASSFHWTHVWYLTQWHVKGQKKNCSGNPIDAVTHPLQQDTKSDGM